MKNHVTPRAYRATQCPSLSHAERACNLSIIRKIFVIVIYQREFVTKCDLEPKPKIAKKNPKREIPFWAVARYLF